MVVNWVLLLVVCSAVRWVYHWVDSWVDEKAVCLELLTAEHLVVQLAARWVDCWVALMVARWGLWKVVN